MNFMSIYANIYNSTSLISKIYLFYLSRSLNDPGILRSITKIYQQKYSKDYLEGVKSFIIPFLLFSV